MKFEELVNTYGDAINENDYILVEYINKNRNKVQSMTLNELSIACSISKTSIIRFTHKLHLSGFSELKTLLKYEKELFDEANSKELSYVDILSNTYIDTANSLRKKDYSHIFSLIEKANRTFLYGSGESQRNAVQELYRIFSLTGNYFYYFDNELNQKDVENSFREGDLFIMISLSGEADETIQLATKLKRKGVKIISITEHKENTLAKISNENIYFSNVTFDVNSKQRNYTSTASLFITCEILLAKYEQHLEQK